jgi:hypothetical protein
VHVLREVEKNISGEGLQRHSPRGDVIAERIGQATHHRRGSIVVSAASSEQESASYQQQQKQWKERLERSIHP